MDFTLYEYPFNATLPSPVACPKMNSAVMTMEEVGQIIQLVISFLVFTNILCSIYGFCRDPLREELQKKVDEYSERINDEVNRADDLETENIKLHKKIEQLYDTISNVLNDSPLRVKRRRVDVSSDESE